MSEHVCFYASGVAWSLVSSCGIQNLRSRYRGTVRTLVGLVRTQVVYLSNLQIIRFSNFQTSATTYFQSFKLFLTIHFKLQTFKVSGCPSFTSLRQTPRRVLGHRCRRRPSNRARHRRQGICFQAAVCPEAIRSS